MLISVHSYTSTTQCTECQTWFFSVYQDHRISIIQHRSMCIRMPLHVYMSASPEMWPRTACAYMVPVTQKRLLSGNTRTKTVTRHQPMIQYQIQWKSWSMFDKNHSSVSPRGLITFLSVSQFDSN